MSDRGSGKGGCLRVLGWGCGCLVAALVLLAVAAYLGRDWILDSDWYQDMRRFADRSGQEFRAALEIRDQLAEAFPAESISIGYRIDHGAGSRRVLALTILNPSFDIPDGEAGAPVALEIARFAAARHPSISEFDAMTIEVRRAAGSFSSEQTYEFPVAQLVAAPDAPPIE